MHLIQRKYFLQIWLSCILNYTRKDIFTINLNFQLSEKILKDSDTAPDEKIIWKIGGNQMHFTGIDIWMACAMSKSHRTETFRL